MMDNQAGTPDIQTHQTSIPAEAEVSMRRFAFLSVLSALALIVSGGCDDSPTADKPAVTHFIMGDVILRPYVDFLGNIHPIFGKGNEVDSVLFADSAAVIARNPSFVEGNDYTYGFSYYEPADSLRFHSGDTATIKIFKGHETATVHLKLLALPLDTVRIALPANHSSVPVGQSIVLHWARVAHADWYSVYLVYDTSTLFGAELRQTYDHAIDTTYIIPGTSHPQNGNYRIFIGAVTGPIPGSDGNIQSETMTGSIYCWAIPGVREGWEITVGSGAAGAGANIVDRGIELSPDLSKYLKVDSD